MRREEFDRRYQLIRLASDGPVRTWHAFAARGTVVMVHEVAPEAEAEASELVALMARLPAGERERILDIHEVEGVAMIVTRFLMDHASLRSWLEAEAGGEAGPTSPPGAATAAGSDAGTAPSPVDEEADTAEFPAPDAYPSPEETGAFTRVFRLSSLPDPAAEAAPSPREDLVDAPPPPESDAPGEFTRMFRAVARPAEGDAGAEGPGAGSAGAAGHGTGDAGAERADPPGEFTRMFRAAVPPQAPPPSADPPPPPLPPLTPSAPPPAPASSPKAHDAGPSHPPPGEGPGEFTRMFALPQLPDEGAGPRREPPPGGATGGNEDDDAYLGRLAGGGAAGRPPLGSSGPPPASPTPGAPSSPASSKEPELPGSAPLGAGGEGLPDWVTAPPATAPPPPPGGPAGGAPPPASPPGDYTRVVRAADRPASAEPNPVAPPPGTAPPPASGPGGTGGGGGRGGEGGGPAPRTLVLGLVGVVILALILVAAVLLLGREAPPGEGEPGAAPVESPETSIREEAGPIVREPG